MELLITGEQTEIDLGENQSDTSPYVNSSFIPVSYELLFLNMKKDNSTKFTNQKINRETNKTYHEDVEID